MVDQCQTGLLWEEGTCEWPGFVKGGQHHTEQRGTKQGPKRKGVILEKLYQERVSYVSNYLVKPNFLFWEPNHDIIQGSKLLDLNLPPRLVMSLYSKLIECHEPNIT